MKRIISWVEIPVSDMQRAVNFYNAVLNFDLEILDCGEEKMACFPTGEGSLSYAPDFEPSATGTLVSLDPGTPIDESIENVKKAGGKIIRPKTKIEAEGKAYFALFTDSEGNTVGLYGN